LQEDFLTKYRAGNLLDRERWSRERAALQRAGPTASIGFPGTVLEDGNGVRYVVEATGEMLAALPNAKPGLNLLQAKTAAEGNGSGAGQFMGHIFNSSALTGRIALRFLSLLVADLSVDEPNTDLPKQFQSAAICRRRSRLVRSYLGRASWSSPDVCVDQRWLCPSGGI